MKLEDRPPRIETVPAYVEVLKVIASLAWPALAAATIWLLLPSIRKVVEARAFTLKFAGIEITAQEATDQIKGKLQDLTDQVIALKRGSDDPVASITAKTARQMPKTILWVDDQPGNNAFEISQLEDRGYEVVTALSTSDAMGALTRRKIGVIISDMGRREKRHYVPEAGLVFLKQAREAGYNQPFIVYSSVRNAQRNAAEVKALGGVGATASPTELLEWLETNLATTTETAADTP